MRDELQRDWTPGCDRESDRLHPVARSGVTGNRRRGRPVGALTWARGAEDGRVEHAGHDRRERCRPDVERSPNE